MKYYDNQIYPIALVLSNDIESVRKEYWWYNEEQNEELPDTSNTAEASTFLMMRKTDEYRALAIGIVFNTSITAKLAAHEGFHATYFTMSQLSMPLDDCSDEAYAYLDGWIADCIDDFQKNNETLRNGWHQCVDGKPQSDYDGQDWVLVRFKGLFTDHLSVPRVAEWSRKQSRWHVIDIEDSDWTNGFVAIEWKPIE